MSLNIDLIKSRNLTEALLTMILSVIMALTSIFILLLLLIAFDFEIDINELVKYSFSEVLTSSGDLAQVLYWTTPLIMTGLSVAIAFQAGLFNIGSQGQMIMGASWSGVWAAVIVPNQLTFLDTPALLIPTTMLVGFTMGGVWGFVPGYLKAKTGAHEVIVTILMNLIALSLVNFMVGSQTYSPFIDKTSLNAYGQTDIISNNARITKINPEISNFLDWSIAIAVVVALFLQIILFRTNFGFKLRATGLNPVASESAGINTQKMTILSMILAGGVAGLGGSFLVMGQIRYYINLESTYGFDGIAVALIGQNIPLGVALAALVFGFLHQSRVNLGENSSIPPEIIVALQAFIIIFIAAPSISRKIISRFKSSNHDSNNQVGKNPDNAEGPSK